MRILFLSLRCPFPPHRGDRIRNYNFIKYLAKHHAVTVVSFVESMQEIENIEALTSFCERTEFVPFSHFEARKNCIFNFFSKAPLQTHYWRSIKMQKTIDNLLQKMDFELVHAHLFRMGQYISNYSEIPKMLDLCDSIALNLSRRIKIDRSAVSPLLKIEQKRTRNYEVDLAQLFDHNTVVAKPDYDYLIEQNTELNLSIIPVGVDPDYFQPCTIENKELNLLFTGTMNYFPNYDAAIYFHNEIWPLIIDKHPDVTLSIVGNNPIAPVRRLADNNITITGYVPDTRPYFDKATIFISPMRSGSGLQVKHLEAMAMGLPVVTTTIGSMGIEAIEKQDLLVADKPHDFANHVNTLLEDQELRRSIGNSSRKLIEEKYNWNILGAQLNEVYQQIAERKTCQSCELS